MPLISRYNTQIKGAMTFIGNTVGLSKLAGELKAGTLGSIGAFTSLNTNLQVATFPPGTTLNINQNGSAAQLVLPAGSSVVRAELIWGGSYYYRYQQGGNDTLVDLSAQINNPVYLTTPSSGGRVQINPDPVTAQTESFTLNDGTGTRTIKWYMRSADVTTWVSSAGTYSTEQIVGAIVADDNLGVATNHAGWTLAVVYQNLGMEERTLYLWVGAQMINGSSVSSADIPISGFQTKPSGPISARLLLSSQEGDANIVGDRMYFGQNTGSLTNLSGPNNPISNFFASQINDDNGNLNTIGTFGTLNANAIAGTQIVGGRQGWDITNIDVSPEMVNNQSSALIRITTNGDAYMMNGVGLQLDVLKLDAKVVKTVDLQYADLGDTLTYTINITNNGNVPMTNIVLTDTTPAGTTFVPNSVKIGANAMPGAQPSNGVLIGDLGIGSSIVITFKVIITSLSAGNPIKNSASINYHYSPTLTTTTQSNVVETQLSYASILPNKSVNKDYAQLGETLTYTTTLNNTGTTGATNVFFKDILPNGVTFVAGSVKIDGVTQSLLDPNVGFYVADIGASLSRVISFEGVVSSSFPVVNPIPNTSEASYSYSVDPIKPVVNVPKVTSNQVTTQINEAILTTIKAVDKAVAGFGEVVTYTTTLTNSGNVAATSIQFMDIVPQGMTLVAGSVKVNGVPNVSLDPNIGFVLPPLSSGASHVISFKVTVDSSFPNTNPIPNVNGAVYSYLVDPLGTPVSGVTTISNQVETQVKDSLLTVQKQVDKGFADVGEVLTYTINVTNQGNIMATGVSFKDSMPVGASFVAGSVTVGGVGEGNYNPEVGFVLPNIPAGGSLSISFNAQINSTIPIPAAVSNQAVVSVVGKPDVNSNKVTTEIKHASIQAVKQVDQNYVDLSGVLRYTLTLTNTGNTPASGVIVTDSMPVDTTFIPGSVVVEGVSQPGANPISGINIGTLLAGEVVIITFRVLVKSTLPISSQIQNTASAQYTYSVDPGKPPIQGNSVTNPVSTLVNTARINTVKVVDKGVADLGEDLLYTLTLTNEGTTAANNIILYDVIPVGTTLISGSVKVGGVPQPGADPAVGILAGTLLAGASKVISFSVKIGSEIPLNNTLSNRSTTSYEYFVDPSATHVNGPASTSNEVVTTLAHAALNVEKSVNKTVATIGETITYTVVLTNKGNVEAAQIILTDTIPIGATFVPDSIKVDGTPVPGVDIESGVSLGTLAPGGSVTVNFDITLGASLPSINPMPNIASAAYAYTVDPNNPLVTGNQPSNLVQVLAVEQQNFASLTAVKSVDKKYAEIGETLVYEIILTNTGNTDALDLVVTDPLAEGIVFSPGSVNVGGITRPFDDIQAGIAITMLPAGGTISITFAVTINNLLPTSNPIPNYGVINYKFRPEQNLDPIDGPVVNSNTVTTIVYAVNVGARKVGNLHYADVDSILTYTVGVGNLGNIALDAVTITDSMPVGVVFIPGSVTIDGVIAPLANPEEGIDIGTLLVNRIILVTYQVQISGTIPNPNPIVNTAQIDYEYLIDPLAAPIKGKPIITDPTSTQINHGEISLTKLASSHDVDWNEEIIYTIFVKNTGNVETTNIVVTDNIPQGTSFITGSVVVAGESKPLMVPDMGMTLDTLSAGDTTEITFRVKVDTSFPAINPIPNEANSTYYYKVDPQDTVVVGISAPSNTERVQVNHGQLNVLKEQNKDYVDVGEELVYTFTLTNTGNVNLTEIKLIDSIPEGAEFVTESVVVGGLWDILGDPRSGISIPDLKSTESILVTFRIKVISIPSINPMPNQASATYSYLVNPLEQDTRVNDTANSQTVFAKVNHAQLLLDKSVDKTVVGINGVLTYTFLVRNIGSTAAQNVVLKDILPVGTQFIDGSMVVSGVNRPLDTPDGGIDLGIIGEGIIIPISFSANVGSELPAVNPLINVAQVEYEYKVNPADLAPVVAPVVFSQEVSTLVNQAKLSVQKILLVGYADVGEVVTYTIRVTNEGNVTASEVILVDILAPGASFVTGSVVVGMTLDRAADPSSGIVLPDIMAGDSIDVAFKVKIGENLPDPNPIPNTALANYRYQISQASTPVAGEPAMSNETTLQVNTGQVKVSKYADHMYKDVGETIIYTLVLTNVGNMVAQQLVLTDLLETETEFVVGSVTIDESPDAGANPEVGIKIDNMQPGAVSVITFEAKVIGIPKGNPIHNKGVLDYAYKVDPNQSLRNKQEESNVTEVYILSAELETVKSANQLVTSEGEVFAYELKMTNIGNVTAQNVFVQDIVPVGTSFVPGTVWIDGEKIVGADPNSGINIPDIAAGDTSYLTFNVRVQEGAPNPIVNTMYTNYAYKVDPTHPLKLKGIQSNEVSVENKRAKISLVKSANKEQVVVGDEVTYTFVIDNTGEVDLENVIVKDLLEEQLDFVEGSVSVQGVNQPLENILTGVTIGTLKVAETKTITFKARVTKKINEKVSNQGIANLFYKLLPEGEVRIKEQKSNWVNILVEAPNLMITKEADLKEAQLGQIITYHIVLLNTGDLPLLNVIFKDELPKSALFIPESFTLNGTKVNGVNLEKGINIGSLGVGVAADILYQVKVVSGACEGGIQNFAYAIYEYELDNHTVGVQTTQKVGERVSTRMSSFKQIAISKVLELAKQKPSMEEVEDTRAEVKIEDTYVIKTIERVSYEGQRLSGYKLIIHGDLQFTVEYTANSRSQQMHSDYFTTPFTSFVILPIDYVMGQDVEVSAVVEDIEGVMRDERIIEVNIMILVIAKVLD